MTDTATKKIPPPPQVDRSVKPPKVKHYQKNPQMPRGYKPIEKSGIKILKGQSIRGDDILDLINVNANQVQYMLRKGMIKQLAPGIYDFESVIRGGVEFATRKKVTAEGEEIQHTGTPYDKARARKMVASARIEELKVEELEGRLIDKNEEYRKATKVFLQIRTMLMNLGSRVSPLLLMRDDEREVRKIIDDEVRANLEILSDPENVVGKDVVLEHERLAQEEVDNTISEPKRAGRPKGSPNKKKRVVKKKAKR